MTERSNTKNIARDIRKSLVRMHTVGSHFGSAMSIVDILSVLYFRILRIDSPSDPARDRFLLSKGHAASAWYATLARKGFCPLELLDKYAANGGPLCGHPVRGAIPGIEASTGSLGHGLPIGAGMAWAARNDGTGARVFVLMGDGEVQEGSVWEAAILAARLQLENLTAIIDANNLQGFDRVENIQPIRTLPGKFAAFGWGVKEVDGHDHEALFRVFSALPFAAGKPSMVIAHTVKGKGIKDMEGKLECHYLSVPRDKVEKYIEELGEY
jgi:transketolase